MENQSKWWNNASCSLESFNVCSLINGSFSKDSSDVCDQCKSRFSLLKRKKVCEKCGLIYCKACLFNLGQTKVCRKCKIFNLWPIDKLLVASLRVRDLMYYLQTNRISTNTCKEKNDLVELVLVHLNIKHYKPQARSDNSNVPRNRNQPSATPVNPNTSTNQSQNITSNDEGIRVYSMDATEEADDPLYGWCIVDNPIVGGLAETTPEALEQATTSTGVADNIEVQSNIEINNSAESDNNQERCNIAINSGNSDDNNGRGNETDNVAVPMGEEALSSEAQEHGESGSSEILLNAGQSNSDLTGSAEPAVNMVPELYPGIDALQDLLNTAATNLGVPTTDSSSSTPQHRRGSPIEVSSIIKLSNLTDENDIKALSVRQCKEILTLHRVDFSGVTEKHELVSKLSLLWKDFKERYSDLSSVPEDQICKICMDAPIDCVFLNCGHVISCIFCGKQMAECPICRQNVVRVVRIFKN